MTLIVVSCRSIALDLAISYLLLVPLPVPLVQEQIPSLMVSARLTLTLRISSTFK